MINAAVSRRLRWWVWLAVAVLLIAACRRSQPLPAPVSASASASASAGPSSSLPACSALIQRALSEPALDGTPKFDETRVEVLGRARGEPMVFVREPAPTSQDALPEQAQQLLSRLGPRSAAWVDRALKSVPKSPQSLRAILLREGYVYSSDPQEALSLVTQLHIADLFDEPEVWLQRRSSVHRLVRTPIRGGVEYRYAEGTDQGRAAELVFGDRLAANKSELDVPLHRDLASFAAQHGTSRITLQHRSVHQLVARLRFGTQWVDALLATHGAMVELECLDGPADALAAVDTHQKATSTQREARIRVEQAIDRQVAEALRFDRPEGEKTAEYDGILRPQWAEAYRRRQPSFSHEGVSYPVFDSAGRPWPPQVCVDFVLDTYERASGSWYQGRGRDPGRIIGAMDFNQYAIENRRGVLGFFKFAAATPELFDVRKFEGAERIPFGQRSKFFAFLLEHADEVTGGDVVAIQGRKRDGLIHQHAIFVESSDPITGFPHGLADQMKRPRRRTWEGIMAEAPARSLLFRARPTEKLWESIAPPSGS